MTAADHTGSVAVVTGAAGVIGRTLSLALAEAGAAVVAADLTPPTEVAAEIGDRGGRALAVELDVTDAASAEAMVQAAVDAFGRVDALVNNAGYFRGARRGPFDTIPVEEWDRAFAVNVRGVWNCCRAAAPRMREQGGGHIVNIGSNTVFRGVPLFAHYVTSKAALIGLTRGLARELGDDKVAVNLLYPDFIPDDALLAAQPGNNERVVGMRCFRRTELPEDLVGAALFLTGPESGFVTGASVVVNGGAYFL
ncbi:SDR family NAD(P)-dependent oxidoreductase [Streptomyces sp. NPDC058045]|uniref:SDR family NAD(P)-dependent oxidoreductase n=1 Tax=Streptomyces sp. NPDC058045 TaxID=3346311 RepID=UPI0036E25E45